MIGLTRCTRSTNISIASTVGTSRSRIGWIRCGGSTYLSITIRSAVTTTISIVGRIKGILLFVVFQCGPLPLLRCHISRRSRRIRCGRRSGRVPHHHDRFVVVIGMVHVSIPTRGLCRTHGDPIRFFRSFAKPGIEIVSKTSSRNGATQIVPPLWSRSGLCQWRKKGHAVGIRRIVPTFGGHQNELVVLLGRVLVRVVVSLFFLRRLLWL